jgi:hypothetical protein
MELGVLGVEFEAHGSFAPKNRLMRVKSLYSINWLRSMSSV